jgi:hypothetical protein
MENEMAEKQSRTDPSFIKRDGQDDDWLNSGLAFAHRDGGSFNIILKAFALDGKIVCRDIGDDEAAEAPPQTGPIAHWLGDRCR